MSDETFVVVVGRITSVDAIRSILQPTSVSLTRFAFGLYHPILQVIKLPVISILNMKDSSVGIGQRFIEPHRGAWHILAIDDDLLGRIRPDGIRSRRRATLRNLDVLRWRISASTKIDRVSSNGGINTLLD